MSTDKFLIMDDTDKLKSIFVSFYIPTINDCLGKRITQGNVLSRNCYVNFVKIDNEIYFSFKLRRPYYLSDTTKRRIINKLNKYDYKLLEQAISDEVVYEISGPFVNLI